MQTDAGYLSGSQPGSDAHGLIERIAYRIWQKTGDKPGRDAIYDWHCAEVAAQNACADWPHIFGEGAARFYEQLRCRAEAINDEFPGNAPEENWYRALDSFADLVMSRERWRRI
ncbi:MAG: DUF2934 domain-containing protein [Candidatus Aenigmarchaeota archaeon]|nr:DUF2934 domain-containing protein [Candidatus Aenigmarchaeota archaeon]